MAEKRRARTGPQRPPASNARTLVTPEGVDLGVELASTSARASAFLIDLVIMGGILIALVLLLGPMLEESAPAIVFLLAAFVLRAGWFSLWEMTPKAATPGKRLLRIRVAMRSGGRLTPDAIIARNLTRELELFLPISALFSGVFAAIGLAGLGGAIAAAASFVWCLIFVLLPLFNRDRLRAGDMIGGTWVVEAPQPKLLPDLAADAERHRERFAFSEAQADAYGVKELHVLEEVIRRYDRSTAADVARRIREKIGWTAAPDETDREFLNAYYAALRRRLEQQLLFGRRRKDKHDRG